MRLGRWKYAFVAGIAVIATLLVLAAAAVPYSADTLREQLIRAMSERLSSEVEIGRFNARVYPRLHIDGEGLVIRLHGRTDVPPLISVKAFEVNAGLFPLLRRHVTDVKLVGLDIRIPPGSEGAPGDEPVVDETQKATDLAQAAEIVVDHLETTDASLTILPDKPNVAPKVWAIHALSLRDVGVHGRMPFDATLTNAVPPGEIATAGSFGPWNADRPGLTPLSGRFRFDDADLAFFKGVFGTLSAHGTFGGWLARLDIHGETDTPDFGITTALNTVPLHTTYHSIVDATNGNTVLEPIEATFLNTSLVATGAVLETPGKKGRTVSLDVKIDNGRIEDVLRLAVKTSAPPMTGGLRLDTKFVLPPGDRDVVDKVELDGHFSIDGARFTSLDIQKQIDELSHRSRGKDPDEKPARVLSGFSGAFRLRSANLGVPAVQFAVPGATVHLAGDYRLRSGRLDFRGNLLMAAKVSDTVRGFKHVLLKLVDPLFRSDRGGSVIPIRITGTRKSPDFGLDKGRLFRR